MNLDSALNLIREFESCVLHVYRDAVGIPTIGYGHVLQRGERLNTITKLDAERLLAADIAPRVIALRSMLRQPATENQFNAMLSWMFNVGESAARRSTLIRKFNAGDIDGAANEFRRWCYAGGKVLRGLVRRRRAERNLFLRS